MSDTHILVCCVVCLVLSDFFISLRLGMLRRRVKKLEDKKYSISEIGMEVHPLD